MSGGQMQRVAIARALVNNPDILLADEPTGALDSETSIQVMELLKEVAKDRLVVMVTHNPELAQQYATRIVNLKDGVIRSDTAPYEPDTAQLAPAVHKNMGHSSMSWWTSLALSFNNLWTKKTRTLLTAFRRLYRHHWHCADHFPVHRCQPVYRRYGTGHPFRVPGADPAQRHGSDQPAVC